MTDKQAEIYLVCGRKQELDYDPPKGWIEVFWERFSYTESYVFRKPFSEFTEEDKEFYEDHKNIPTEFEFPGNYEAVSSD